MRKADLRFFVSIAVALLLPVFLFGFICNGTLKSIAAGFGFGALVVAGNYASLFGGAYGDSRFGPKSRREFALREALNMAEGSSAEELEVLLCFVQALPKRLFLSDSLLRARFLDAVPTMRKRTEQ